MDNAIKWVWGTLNGRKTWMSAIAYFAYLLLCEYVWKITPDDTVMQWIAGIFGVSLAHKVQKAGTATGR